jgi:hypothetical protein
VPLLALEIQAPRDLVEQTRNLKVELARTVHLLQRCSKSGNCDLFRVPGVTWARGMRSYKQRGKERDATNGTR